MRICRFFLPIFMLIFPGINHNCIGQSIDHWETIIYADDDWNYQIGSEDIPMDWIEENFNISQWPIGPGGFGYGDDDDNTVINNAFSVFIRKDFDLTNKDVIRDLILHADYDDGFVAYLNGIEIARKNLGTTGQRVPYDEETPEFVEAKLYQGSLPTAIQVDPEFLVNGKNTLAVQIHNHNSTSSDLSSNFFLSAGIENDSNYFSPTPVWFDLSVFESKLPIIKITTEDNEPVQDEPRIKASMGVINNGPGALNYVFDPFNGYEGFISIEHRGTSSLTYDKKGYALETQNPDGSNNNVELLGLPKENDWILYGPYSDKTLLRNVLTYHLGNLTGHYAPRTQLCELFLNDEYEGIYVLTEKIKEDKNRVDIASLTSDDNVGDELTGGYIIKVDRNEQNIPGLGWFSTFPDFKFIAFVEPKDDDITAEQQNYIMNYMFNFESAMASESYDEVYTNYIDINSLVDYFLVTEISKHIDAYKLSFYMYKDKDSNGGKLHFGPLWDFNFGYGNFNFACPNGPQGWAYEFPDCGTWHPFWARKLIDIPNVQHLSNCRWQELRSGPFKTETILRYINDLKVLMGPAVDRNFQRWPVLGEFVYANDFIGNDYDEEMAFLTNWIRDRLEWLDANMLGDCDLYTTGTKEKLDLILSIFPNPASDFLHFSIKHDEALKLEIYDLENRLVKSDVLLPNSNEVVDISTLAKGAYTLIFTSVERNNVLHVERLAVVR